MMHKRGNLLCRAACMVAGVIGLGAASAWAQPTITLTTSALQSTLGVGDSTTITVSAVVTGGAADDGITAYDLDLLPLNKSGIHFVGTAVQEGNDYAISGGTPDAATGGLLGITGLFFTTNKGIGAAAALFTVQVYADAAGVNSVSAGLSVQPSGTGIPFQLNVTGDYVAPGGGKTQTFTVDSSAAIAPLTVTAVPEPSTALLCAGLLGAAIFRPATARSRRAPQRISRSRPTPE